MGEAAGVSLVLARHRAALGVRAIAGRAALDAARFVSLHARRDVLQLPGSARLQGQVPPGLAVAVPGVSGRADPAAYACGRGRADRRRLLPDPPEITEPRRGGPSGPPAAVRACGRPSGSFPASRLDDVEKRCVGSQTCLVSDDAAFDARRTRSLQPPLRFTVSR